jgi:hypothetical protein
MAKDVVCGAGWSPAADLGSTPRRFARNVDSDSASMLELALRAGLTTQGELLDAAHMAAVASAYLGAQTQVVDSFSVRDVVGALLRRSAVCVAYDASPNHEPANLAGEHAHWALLRGFALRVCSSSPTSLVRQDALAQDAQRSDVFHLLAERLTRSDCEALEAADPGSLFVFAQHGKSKHEAAWPYAALRESCANLRSISPVRYVEPHDHDGSDAPLEDLVGLRDRLVVIPRLA